MNFVIGEQYFTRNNSAVQMQDDLGGAIIFRVVEQGEPVGLVYTTNTDGRAHSKKDHCLDVIGKLGNNSPDKTVEKIIALEDQIKRLSLDNQKLQMMIDNVRDLVGCDCDENEAGDE